MIVLTGTGRAFSAGADRSLIDGSVSPHDRSIAGAEFKTLITILDNCEKPVVAAVNGLAVGVGCTILLHCDLVIAGESARFRLPFTALGIVPEAGSSVLFPAIARWGDAMWAMLSSEWIDAQAAHDMGLAWRVVPDAELVEATKIITATVAALDPMAVQATKRLLQTGRADAVRLAVQRETAEMTTLLERQPGQPGRT